MDLRRGQPLVVAVVPLGQVVVDRGHREPGHLGGAPGPPAWTAQHGRERPIREAGAERPGLLFAGGGEIEVGGGGVPADRAPLCLAVTDKYDVSHRIIVATRRVRGVLDAVADLVRAAGIRGRPLRRVIAALTDEPQTLAVLIRACAVPRRTVE